MLPEPKRSVFNRRIGRRSYVVGSLGCGVAIIAIIIDVTPKQFSAGQIFGIIPVLLGTYCLQIWRSHDLGLPASFWFTGLKGSSRNRLAFEVGDLEANQYGPPPPIWGPS